MFLLLSCVESDWIFYFIYSQCVTVSFLKQNDASDNSVALVAFPNTSCSGYVSNIEQSGKLKK